jgi:hypothetical protein
MVLGVLVEGIEGILNPELSTGTIKQVAQRIHSHPPVPTSHTINKVNQVPMNLLIPDEHDVSGRQHIILKTGNSFATPYPPRSGES